VRKHPGDNGKPTQLRITPRQARFQATKDKVRTLCKQAAGATPEQLIDRLNPVLRGWAHYHRHVIGGHTFAPLDSLVWRRLFRWAKLRHPNKTGHEITERYFPPPPGQRWRFTDPVTGKHIIRVGASLKPQRHIKVKGDANPFNPDGEAYFQDRDRALALRASSAFRGSAPETAGRALPGLLAGDPVR
jgi:RNA-directed DNA polymerase